MSVRSAAVVLLLLHVQVVHGSSAAAALATSYPVPTALPPHSWDSVGQKLFIHGCKKDGLFNSSELALAAKYSLMTVEKGQGLELPGFADDKMAAIARQWKEARRAAKLPEGWALFYLNAHFDWPFFAIHTQMEDHPIWGLHTANAGESACARGQHQVQARTQT